MASLTKTAGSVTNNTTSGETYWQKDTYTGGGDPPADLGLSYLELLSDDNEYALWLGGGSTSYYLQCTQFDFSSIPDGAQINGVELSFKRLNTGSADAFDLTIKLVKNGTITGNNKSVGATWSVTEETVTFGGASDLWGVSLTAADVKASNFGVVIQIEKDVVFGDPDPSAGIDYLTLTVYYDGPASTNNSATLCITGTYSSSPNNYIDFYTSGKLSSTSSTSLYTRGTLNAEQFTTLELFISNSVPDSNNTTLYTKGITTQENGIRLYISGRTTKTNNIPLFLQHVPNPGSNSALNLFVRSLSQDEAFPPSGGSASNYLTLMLKGATSFSVGTGDDNTDPTYPLFQMNLYLKGAISDFTTSNMNLFLEGRWYPIVNYIPLFLYNNRESATNNLPLMTAGLGSEDSEGYTPGNGAMNLFIQRNTAGKTDLYLLGPYYTLTEGCSLYINSNLTKSSGITLAMPQTIGRQTKSMTLFERGW